MTVHELYTLLDRLMREGVHPNLTVRVLVSSPGSTPVTEAQFDKGYFQTPSNEYEGPMLILTVKES